MSAGLLVLMYCCLAIGVIIGFCLGAWLAINDNDRRPRQ